MKEEFSRSELLLGETVMKRLADVRVIVFGLGGVGSWAAETLVRTGLVHLTIVDFDRVAPSNINRQMPATRLTVGLPKTEVVRRRLLEINPDAEVVAIEEAYNAETAHDFDFNAFDYVIDAIDSLRDKALLINNVTRSSCRLFSSMGAALKTDPTKIEIAEFWKVKGDRLAAALRVRFKKSGEFPAKKFKVVFSPEIHENREPDALSATMPDVIERQASAMKPCVNGSLMQVTAVAGITLASLVVNDLLSHENG